MPTQSIPPTDKPRPFFRSAHTSMVAGTQPVSVCVCKMSQRTTQGVPLVAGGCCNRIILTNPLWSFLNDRCAFLHTLALTLQKKPGQLSRDRPPTASTAACFINGAPWLCRLHNSYCARGSDRHSRTVTRR